jgi:hypothetical protein
VYETVCKVICTAQLCFTTTIVYLNTNHTIIPRAFINLVFLCPFGREPRSTRASVNVCVRGATHAAVKDLNVKRADGGKCSTNGNFGYSPTWASIESIALLRPQRLLFPHLLWNECLNAMSRCRITSWLPVEMFQPYQFSFGVHVRGPAVCSAVMGRVEHWNLRRKHDSSLVALCVVENLSCCWFSQAAFTRRYFPQVF